MRKSICSQVDKRKVIISNARYVDDTQFIIKKKDTDNFDKNLKVIIGTFENSVLHFQNIEIKFIQSGI